MHTLPTHILNALSGSITSVNSITAPIQARTHTPLNGTPLSINLTSSISAIDDNDYTIEVHTYEGDNTHISIE